MTKNLLDDTIPLHCLIENLRVDSHVTYEIRVWRGVRKMTDSWTVSRRYSDFDALHAALQLADVDLHLPPKKVFGNKDRMFVIERQRQLESYLQTVLREPVLACQLPVKQFLDPDNYSFNFYEEAYRHVSMFFRSEVNWELVEPLPRIGWRFRKEYFMIRPKDSPKSSKLILSYCEPGHPLLLSEKDLSTSLRLLPTIQHPNIVQTIRTLYNGTGAIIVRPFFDTGSLRDLIYKTKPTALFLKKYGSQKSRGVNYDDIRRFGRQILEGLKFLIERGMLFGHLHSGNIFMERRVCKLSDLENPLLSLPPFYKANLAEFKKIQSKEHEAVYAFGLVLYEMGCGCMMRTAAMNVVPSYCHGEVRALLESFLTEKSLKSGLPTVDDLISNPLFSPYTPPSEKPQLKVPSKLKESFRQVCETEEASMQETARTVDRIKKADKEKSRQASHDKKVEKFRQQYKEEKAKSRASATTSKQKSKSPADTPPPQRSAPPAPPPPASNPSPPAAQTQTSSGGSGRGDLLSSIAGFKKGGLKKAETNDRSAPKL
ncbi:PX domain-containing protein kinase-like protein [Corticium candelabrum]|uniref:PX domain-containing protein kinase-like protein n=1 Tax=Corticium candelabrum TaxID=121492 RepID=UPI002E25C383|nr:PX domain-containing protein kinase-like protein [Corticium candelabrum]